MIRRGPRTEALSQAQVRFLTDYRYQHGLSVHVLPRAMEAPFKWQTMQKALDGKPISDRFHHFIVEWIKRHQPVEVVTKTEAFEAPPLSGKDRAAGERAE
jgi:hypothetical protein